MTASDHRYFIGFKAHISPFIDFKGRITTPHHLTLVHLKNTSLNTLVQHMHSLPVFPFPVAPCLSAIALTFLPKHNPRSAALIFAKEASLHTYQTNIAQWLTTKNLNYDNRPFVPHVTLCRHPYDSQTLSSIDFPMAVPLGSICVFASTGQGHYDVVKELKLPSAFTLIDHTADFAFDICGESLHKIYENARLALCWISPCIYSLQQSFIPDSLESIIKKLNELVAIADVKYGSSCKAVSYHGKLKTLSSKILQWRMIIDV